MVSHDIWDKIQRIVAELTFMDMEDSEGVHWDRMESIRELLIYDSRKYRDMNTYLKGLFFYKKSDKIQRQGWMAITRGRVEDGQTLWKMGRYG